MLSRVSSLRSVDLDNALEDLIHRCNNENCYYTCYTDDSGRDSSRIVHYLVVLKVNNVIPYHAGHGIYDHNFIKYMTHHDGVNVLSIYNMNFPELPVNRETYDIIEKHYKTHDETVFNNIVRAFYYRKHPCNIFTGKWFNWNDQGELTTRAYFIRSVVENN